MQVKNYIKAAALLILFFYSGSITSQATILTIQVGGASNSFSPASATIFLGDTVRWQWAAGFHTSTSTAVPAGAATWDQTMSSAADNFDYIPSVTGAYNYLCTPHAPGMAGTFTVSAPLSVTMDQLKGELNPGSHVLLSWNTYTEDNNKLFEVQRSTDGRTFKVTGTELSKAKGGNSSTPIAYSHTDKEQLGARAFYRLRQVDNDGKSSYSNVFFIARQGANDLVLHVHPNPTSTQVMIHIAGKIGDKAELQLLDLSGKVLDAVTPSKDNTEMASFDLSKLAAGTYLIRYTDVNQTVTEKVTKKD